MTPDINSLLTSSAGDGEWCNTAIVGGPWEDDGSLAMGFFELADAAVRWWRAGHRNDAIAIPIIYNYRHGIELALKEEIREAAACLRRDGIKDPGTQADKLDQWLSDTHSIGKLVNQLTKLLSRFNLGESQEIPDETLDILRKLHVIDLEGRHSAIQARRRGLVVDAS